MLVWTATIVYYHKRGGTDTRTEYVEAAVNDAFNSMLERGCWFWADCYSHYEVHGLRALTDD